MSAQEIFEAIGTIGTFTIGSLAGAGALKLIEHFLQKSKEKELLTLANEHAKTMINYEKYIDKKYEVYPQMVHLFIEAESVARMITANIVEHPDYSSFTDEQIEETIRSHPVKIAQQDITNLLNELRQLTGAQKNTRFVNFLQVYDILEFNNLRQKAVNYYVLNQIYLSEKVNTEMRLIVNNIADLQLKIKNRYQLPLTDAKQARKEMEEIRDLQKNIQERLNDVNNVMRKELSADS